MSDFTHTLEPEVQILNTAQGSVINLVTNSDMDHKEVEEDQEAAEKALADANEALAKADSGKHFLEEIARQEQADEDAKAAAKAEQIRLEKQAVIDARDAKPEDETVDAEVVTAFPSVVEAEAPAPAPKAAKKK